MDGERREKNGKKRTARPEEAERNILLWTRARGCGETRQEKAPRKGLACIFAVLRLFLQKKTRKKDAHTLL